MNHNQTVFIVDAGNSFLKVGVFKDQILENVVRIGYLELSDYAELLNNSEDKVVFISSVLNEYETNKLIDIYSASIVLKRDDFLPIQIKYESPETLGLDRICNSVASFFLAKGKHSVAIDIGTCIKFDFTDKEGNYLGGSISPGINLRYKSMNDYTGKLPLIKDRISSDLIGNNTLNSMRSGVINGIKAEIDQFIDLYSQQYQDLTFFVTGGDAVYFDFPFKNNIFVDENLTLKGLHQIYLVNAK